MDDESKCMYIHTYDDQRTSELRVMNDYGIQKHTHGIRLSERIQRSKAESHLDALSVLLCV